MIDETEIRRELLEIKGAVKTIESQVMNIKKDLQKISEQLK